MILLKYISDYGIFSSKDGNSCSLHLGKNKTKIFTKMQGRKLELFKVLYLSHCL